MDYGILEAEIRASIRRMGMEEIDGENYYYYVKNCYYYVMEFRMLNVQIFDYFL